MKFWAIAYQYDSDYYYNFSKEDSTDLDSECLLPTKEMAETYIEDNLGTDFVPVEINIETISRSGTWSHTRGKVDRWDWQDDWEDED